MRGLPVAQKVSPRGSVESRCPSPGSAAGGFGLRSFFSPLLAVLLIVVALSERAGPAEASPWGTIHFTSSGNVTETVNGYESSYTWDYDLTWTGKIPDSSGLGGTTQAVVSGSVHLEAIRSGPGLFSGTCTITDIITWSDQATDGPAEQSFTLVSGATEHTLSGLFVTEDYVSTQDQMGSCGPSTGLGPFHLEFSIVIPAATPLQGIASAPDDRWSADIGPTDGHGTATTATVEYNLTPSGNIQGDLNCDGQVTSRDALVLLQFSSPATSASPAGCPAPDSVVADRMFGDVNCDGEVDTEDALAILGHVAAVIQRPILNCVPIGELLE